MPGEIKKWGGWNKLSREEADQANERPAPIPEPSAPPPPKKPESPLAPDKLSKIDTKELKNRAQQEYSRRISKIDTVKIPKICEYCGNDISIDHFIIFAPGRHYICRACRQSPHRCQNCGDVLTKGGQEGGHSYCKECLNNMTCHCTGDKLSADTAIRVPGQKGIYSPRAVRELPHCLFCPAPTVSADWQEYPGYPVCFSHAASAVRSTKDLTHLHFHILDLIYELEMDFSFDFKELELKLVKSADFPGIEKMKTSAVFHFFRDRRLIVLTGVPELDLSELLLEQYAMAIFPRWSKVGRNQDLINMLTVFLKMLYYDRMHIYQEYEKTKKQGLSGWKAFQPLYQAAYKSGYLQGYHAVRELLNP